MERKEAVNEVLNDLIKINNDRIAGYQKAKDEANDLDIDLKALFDEMVRQSTEYKQELADEIIRNEGAIEDDTTTAGKIYRAWMDIKATMTEADRHSILEACEFEEDATQRAYDAALSNTALQADSDSKEVVAQQQAALRKSHELIKVQREAHTLLK